MGKIQNYAMQLVTPLRHPVSSAGSGYARHGREQ